MSLTQGRGEGACVFTAREKREACQHWASSSLSGATRHPPSLPGHGLSLILGLCSSDEGCLACL